MSEPISITYNQWDTTFGTRLVNLDNSPFAIRKLQRRSHAINKQSCFLKLINHNYRANMKGTQIERARWDEDIDITS